MTVYNSNLFTHTQRPQQVSSSSFGASTSIGHSGVEPGSYSSKREHQVEERYENGRLVSGRKEEKEWEDGTLLRHDKEHYGEVTNSFTSLIFFLKNFNV